MGLEMDLNHGLDLENMVFEFDGQKVKSLWFRFKGADIILKADKFEHITGPFYIMPTTVTPHGYEPTESGLRYDSGRGSFIDTLLPWPTPYKDFDHQAFDIEMANCNAVWYMSMVVRAFIGAGKIKEVKK